MGGAREHGAITVGGGLRWTAMYGIALLCDYMLITDECYAAAEKLTGDPERIAGLAAIDVLKVLMLVLTLVGCALATIKIDFRSWLAA